MPVLSKHAVLHGPADFCCLLCEVSFKWYEQALEHVATEAHVAKWEASSYTEKYESQRIRKIKKLYFCEPCNLVLSSSQHVPPHIAEYLHQSNNSKAPVQYSSKFRHIGNDVVYEDVLIEEKAWNGFVNLCCVLCDEDWDEEHAEELKHIVNRIQMKVLADTSSNPFRKIDNSKYQCLLCNLTMSTGEFFDHLVTKEHLLVQAARRNAKHAIEENKDTVVDQINNKVEAIKEQETTNTRETNEKSQNSAPSKITPNDTESKETPSDIVDDNTNLLERIIAKPKKANSVNNSTAKTNGKHGKLNDEAGSVLVSDSGMHFCLLCQWEFAPKDYNNHLSNVHHKINEAYEKKNGEKLKEAVKGDNKEIKTKSRKESSCEPLVAINCYDVDGIFEMMDHLQKELIGIDVIMERGFCKLCKIELDINENSLKKHMQDHKQDKDTKGVTSTDKIQKKSIQNTQKSKLADDILFYKNNHIIIHKETGKMYCDLCKTDLQPQRKCIEEHVNGIKHKKTVANKEKTAEVAKEEKSSKVEKDDTENKTEQENTLPFTLEYMNKFVAIWKINLRDCIINNMICVTVWSYCLVKSLTDDMHCLACGDFFEVEDFEYHVNGPRHKMNMGSIPVITSLKEEFIRLIGTNTFHCGFCDTVIVSWDMLLAHTKSTSHASYKNACQARLQRQRDPLVVSYDTLAFIRKANAKYGKTYFS